MATATDVNKGTYMGLFMVALATLMHEILLTRIFSVTMWYHFAFMAISIAMFGMTVGAILVYIFPNYFSLEQTKYHMALSSLLLAVSILVSFLTHLCIPFPPALSLGSVYSIALSYGVLSVPFVFSGICVCLALTRFPAQIGSLYAADLAGAAAGCIGVIWALEFTDGPTAVFVASLFSSLGALFFTAKPHFNKLRQLVVVCTLLIAAFVGVHTVLVHNQFPLLRLMWVKNHFEYRPLYEQWNSFSRVRVSGNPDRLEDPFGWGISPTYQSGQKVRQLHMNIDASAYTPITAFDGNVRDLDFLKYDITNFVHYLRPESSIWIIGSGGGRDVLSALAFDQRAVKGIEINENVIRAVNEEFGAFSGHLDHNPKVTFVSDEARSYIARQEEQPDIIQISLIDTWAATASGAYVLTESALYTVDAWKIFLEHLAPRGILTVSRWYHRHRPVEVLRLTSLACASLKQMGVNNPQNHIIVLRHIPEGEKGSAPDGIGTILVSRQPYSQRDLETAEDTAERMQFDLVFTSRHSRDPSFSAIVSGDNPQAFTSSFPINIAAPTDDRPFFFHMLRLQDIFNRDLWVPGNDSFNMDAIFILGILLFITIALTLSCIIFPLFLTTNRATLKAASSLLVFFSCIGFAFMLVEISQLQALIIFLGHPTYALSVVLFTLLLSGGLGSLSTQRISQSRPKASEMVRLSFLLCALATIGLLTPYATHTFQGAATPLRILISLALLFPMGFFMGMPFPLGMTAASARCSALTPWLWGINGAVSVCASVVAVAIGLSFGISVSFWAGFSCYVVAVGAFLSMKRREETP
ncbi:MAG: hypothetical protein SWQ30_04725 [Thermodesulfobacteriota bacterium]|nr:hypothetical protein [Thermodesulfobacteriota bacterium]